MRLFVLLCSQAGAKQAPEAQVDPQQIQDVIIWSSHTFMQVQLDWLAQCYQARRLTHAVLNAHAQGV